MKCMTNCGPYFPTSDTPLCFAIVDDEYFIFIFYIIKMQRLAYNERQSFSIASKQGDPTIQLCPESGVLLPYITHHFALFIINDCQTNWCV